MIQESIQQVVFWVLSFISIFSALGVILLPNIVYSAFLLGLTLISVAGIFFLLNADFVGTAQILIYVGAINILLLFGIMLVNQKQDSFLSIFSFNFNQISLVLICSVIFLSLVNFISIEDWKIGELNIFETSVPTIATQLFSTYLLSFETISVLLLSTLIGAVLIAKNESFLKF